MASKQVMMCLSLFVLSLVMIAEPKSTNLIRIGSSLQPNTNRSSWLSPSGRFAFGFYKQGNGYAVGIWVFNNLENITVVWTANRDDPPVPSNSTIQFTKGGELLLQTGQDEEIKIADLFNERGVSASMMDSGDFVIYNNISQVIWQSFDIPTDTLLDGQSLGKATVLTSSRSTSDYSSGRFHLGIVYWGGLVAYPANHTDSNIAMSREFYWQIKTTEAMKRLSLNLTAGVLQLTQINVTLQVLANISYNSVMNETVIYRATLDADGILRLYLHRFKTDGSSNVTLGWSALQNQCQRKVGKG